MTDSTPLSISSSTTIAVIIERVHNGDPTAIEALIDHSMERFRLLARSMLREFPAVKEELETDDVLQEALLRLQNALKKVTPNDGQSFFGLASRHIRFILIDLARKIGRRTNSPLPAKPLGVHPPENLSQWVEFHEMVGRLPDPERELWDLLFYNNCTQEEAAKVLGVSLRTVKRRWQRARLMLHERLEGEYPPLDSR